MVRLVILLFLSFFSFVRILAEDTQSFPIMFKHLSTSDGLSNNSIRCLYKDRKGYLWVGTDFGLNVYDGYHFRWYNRNNTSLGDDAINNVFEDDAANIWIETSKGYTIFDYRKGYFTNDYRRYLHAQGMDGKDLHHIGSNSENEFWAYSDKRLFIKEHLDKRVKVYQLPQGEPYSIAMSGNAIYLMYRDGQLYEINKLTTECRKLMLPAAMRSKIGNSEIKLYAGSTGLWLHSLRNTVLLNWEPANNVWHDYDLIENKNQKYNRIQQVVEDKAGKLWIITTHTGLFTFDIHTKMVTNYRHKVMQTHTLASDNLNAIYIDNRNTIWLGNFKKGISYYTPSSVIILTQKFTDYDDILAFQQDRTSNDVFIGTDGNGLLRYHPSNNTYDFMSSPANVIVTLHMDSEERLWIGTYQKGLLCYANGKFHSYTTENSKLRENDIFAIASDRYGYIWIGTLRGCIQRLNPIDETIETIMDKSGVMSIRDMLMGANDHLYVSTDAGPIDINVKTKDYDLYFLHKYLREPDVLTMYEDHRGWMWIGQPHGLHVWKPEKQKMEYFNKEEGALGNLVRAISEDHWGQMWIGSGNGVTKVEVVNDDLLFTNYTIRDGLIADNVNIHAIVRLRNGNIMMGTSNGYQTIIPQKGSENAFHSRIYITGLDMKAGGSLQEVLDSPTLDQANKLTFHEDDNSFALSLSTLDLAEARNIKYAYKLNRSDNDWTIVPDNKITFSMLPAGTYQLQMRACNAEGVWSDSVRTLTIEILPPWWRSNWAFTFYFLVMIAIAILIVHYYRMRYRQAALMQAMQVENEKQQQINEMKLQFFANVSHELRTPLTLIISPLEEFLVKNPQSKDGLLKLVLKNARYLLELINQLLDFRRLDAKIENLVCVNDNMLILLGELFHSFDSMAEQRNIKYELLLEHTSLFMDFDYDKMRKIMINLLSNAFKFTPDGGHITVSVCTDGRQVMIRVADNGPGIPDSDKLKIFDRFYQSEQNLTISGGSGLGLHIVSEYVKMHHGKVYVEDNLPQGAVFIVDLPIHQKEAENHQDSAVTKESAEMLPSDDEFYCILLVDDNHEFLHFMADSLSEQYRVLCADNGRRALELLEEEDADLIISDVMMPEMDGIELCSCIKNDIRYSHIPVVLLTAKTGEEHLLEGLNAGADDYINKPFNMQILRLRIEKMIEKDKNRREIFKEEIRIEPHHITITPLDEQMVQRAIQVVEDNLSNPEFSVEDLAGRMNLSRSHFYKKLVKITGKKPIEFIRLIRLKRAQQLLVESQMQIAEIAYLLGYNSPRVFSKHFKEEFAMSPSEFIKKYHADTNKKSD